MKADKNRKEQAIILEFEKLNEIFKDVEEAKRKLVEGLIQDAAFLKVENESLRELLSKTGIVKVHPEYPDIQKPIEAAKQYRQNLNSYAVVIKALNSVLSKNIIDEADELEDYE